MNMKNITLTLSEHQIEALRRVRDAENNGDGYSVEDANHRTDVINEILSEWDEE